MIADVVATDGAYGADNTGSKDSTAAIQLALYDCKSMAEAPSTSRRAGIW